MRSVVLISAIGLLAGCTFLDELELGGSGSHYDPTKIYLKNEYFRVDRRRDLNRFVCLSGPLECQAWGSQTWDCHCP